MRAALANLVGDTVDFLPRMDVIKHKSGVWRTIVLAALVFAASAASAFPVPPPVPLEELAQSADLVCKATVIADRTIADGGPELTHRGAITWSPVDVCRAGGDGQR